MKDILELETRRKIYDLVAKNPGLHLSKIAEILNMRVSLVEYHLIYLVKNQVFNALKESGYLRFYVKGRIGTEDKKVLALLRQKIPLKIILYLLKNTRAQHKDILQNIDIAPSTLSYHLKKLFKFDLITVNTYGDQRGYFISDREKIINILVQYKPYNLFESFKDIWTDLKVD